MRIALPLQRAKLRLASAVILGLLSSTAMASPIALGTFTFDSALFGDTLSESDGGSLSATNWVNTVNANPGSPGVLTGANFDTGIANIGSRGPVSYTIGYSTPIVNGTGADFGVVTARFSADPFSLTINGITQNFAATLGIDSGVDEEYFFGSVAGGRFGASLFVTAIDLSAFGIAAGGNASSITISGSTQLDLIRVAGFADVNAVPEPGSLALVATALLAAGSSLRRRRR